MIPFAENFEPYLSRLGSLDVFLESNSRGNIIDGIETTNYSISLDDKKIGTYFVSYFGEGLISLRYKGDIPGYGEVVLLASPFTAMEGTEEDGLDDFMQQMSFLFHPRGHSLDEFKRLDRYLYIPFP